VGAVRVARLAFAASAGPWLFWAKNTRSDQPGHHSPARLRLAVKRAMATAGVKKGTSHTFRHAFCSFMANSNVPPLIVMKIMGHSSLDIILTYYHLSDQEMLGALNARSFSAMLGPAIRAGSEAGGAAAT
jgi:integrase